MSAYVPNLYILSSKRACSGSFRRGAPWVILLVFLLVVTGNCLADEEAIAATEFGLTYEGNLAPGGLIVGRVNPGTRLHLNGSEVRVAPNGDFLLGFGRDEVGQQELMLSSEGRQTLKLRWSLEPRDYDIQRIEGIASNIMAPSEESLKRIRKETAMTLKARAVESSLEHFKEPFIWPLSGPITGVYGSQRFYNGEPRRPHFGLDIAAPTGTPIVAPAGGKITLAHPDMFYSGGTIILDHGLGLSSTFIHLSRVLVKTGDEVVQGQVIGEVGAAGRATGPHLDWRMNWFQVRLDPQLWMRHTPMPGDSPKN